MENNNKLMGELRLGLDKLRQDVAEGNKILSNLNLDKLNLSAQDALNVNGIIKDLRLIEKEVKKSSQETGKAVDTSGITKSINDLETSVKNSGVKISKFYKDVSSENEALAKGIDPWKEMAESVDAYGKKVVVTQQKVEGETLKTLKTIKDPNDSKKLNTQLAKSELNDMKNYQAEQKIFANNTLKSIDDQIKSAKLLNNELKSELKELDKIEQAQKKVNLEATRQYTAEQANAKYTGVLSAKSLTERLNNISGNDRNQTLGSGDRRNSTFLDRFDVAKDYVIGSKIFNTVFNSLDTAYSSIKNYETGLVDLSRTLNNVTNNDLKNFGQQAVSFSKEFGIPIEQVQSAMTELARAGVDNKDDLTSMTKTVLMGLNTTEIKNASDMTGYLVSAIKQLGLNFKDSEKIIDSWNMLADKYAVKSNDFAEAIQKAGSSSKALGLNINDLNAMVVVLGEATQKSGSEIGNAVKTMETRMLRPDTVKTLESLGVTVMKDAEHFNSFQDIMTQVSGKLDEFGDGSIKANQLLDALGGAWRKNDISVLANSWDQIAVKSKESMNAVGYSVKENEKTMQTLEKKVESLKNSFKELFISFGESGILENFKSIVGGINNVVSAFSKMPSELKQALLVFTEVGLFMKMFSKGLEFTTGQNLTKWIDSLLPKLSIFSNTFGQGNAAMRAFQKASESLSASLINNKIDIDQARTILSELGKQMGLSKTATESLTSSTLQSALGKEKYATAMKSSTKATIDAEAATVSYTAVNKAMDAANKSTIISTLALNAAMLGITALVSGAIIGVSKLYDSFFDVKKAVQKQKDEVQNLTSSYESLKSQVDKLREVEDPTESQKKQLSMLERELELKSQILIIEKKKLVDKEVFGKGVWGDGIVGDIKKDVKEANDLLASIEVSKQKASKALSQGYSVDLNKMTASPINDLKKIELAMIERKKTLEDSLKVSSGDSKQKIQDSISEIDKLLPKLKSETNSIYDNTTAQSSNTDAINENTNSKEKAVGKTKSLANIGKEVAETFSKNKTVIDDVNKVLDEHARVGEWDLQTLMKISEEYPQLLGLLGDDKALEQELIKIKGDKVKASQESLNQQLQLEVDYLNSLTSGYNFDINNFANAQEAKTMMLKSSVNKRIAIYERELNAAMQAFDAAQSVEAKNNALRGAMLAGDNLAMARADVDYHIDRAFALQRLSASVGKYMGNIGSQNYDGKKNYEDKSASDAQREREKQQDEANSRLKQLRDDLSQAIRKKNEEDKENALKNLKEEEAARVAYYQGRIKKLQDELAALQDTTSDEKEKLDKLKKELVAWQREDDTQFGKNKIVDIQKLIKETEKNLKVKELQDKIKTEEDAQKAEEENFKKREDSINKQYDELLQDKNIYAKADQLITSNSQQEILNLMMTYAPKYSETGSLLGKSMADAMLEEIRAGIEGRNMLLNSGYNSVTKSASGGSSGGSGGSSWDGHYYKNGSTGNVVKRIQQALGVAADGIFGSQTQNALINFQKSHGLSADGIVGKNTWKLLGLNTGGYTGDEEGVAYLHKKELILNKDDTVNMLKVIDTTREMVNKFSPMFNVPNFEVPKFETPSITIPESALKPIQYIYQAPLVQQDVNMVNNTPFDVDNNQDNWEKAIKNGLFKTGYGMPIAK